jgi:hypothetical protein
MRAGKKAGDANWGASPDILLKFKCQSLSQNFRIEVRYVKIIL